MTAGQIRALVEERTAESRTLDFKREHYGGGDKGRVEFLRDVTAMSNTDGGTILVGVNEKNGFATGFAGMSSDGFDDQKNRLTALLSTGTDPKLAVEINGLEIDNDNFVVEIEIPKSWVGPHRAIFNNQSYFYMRTTHGNDPMDTRQIRQAILLSENISERMRSFREERLRVVESVRGPVKLMEGPKFAVHLMPARAFSTGDAGDLKLLYDELRNYTTRPPWAPDVINFNFEGLLGLWTDNSPETKHLAYVQAFRNGVIEVVQTVRMAQSEPNSLNGQFCERMIIDTTFRYWSWLTKLAADQNVFVAISLAHVDPLRMTGGDRDVFNLVRTRPFDRSVYQLPEIEIEQPPNNEHELRRLLSQPLDVMWQAAGIRNSPFDNPDGRFGAAQ